MDIILYAIYYLILVYVFFTVVGALIVALVEYKYDNKKLFSNMTIISLAVIGLILYLVFG